MSNITSKFIIVDNERYYRIGGNSFYVRDSSFYEAIALYYSDKTDKLFYKITTGEIIKSNFLDQYKKKLFKLLTQTRVYYAGQYNINDYIVRELISRKLSRMEFSTRKFVKKVNSRWVDVIDLKNIEQMAQFQLMFSEYFID